MAIAIGTGNVWGALHTTVSANYDTSITPGATPNGVCAIVVQNATGDAINSAVYGTGAGSVTLSRLDFRTVASEAGGVYIYWAGNSATFPAGAQTVRFARNATAASMRMVCWTMTVTAGQQVQLDGSVAGGSSASVTNPSWSHSSLVDNVVAFLGLHSGNNTMTTTQAAGWTTAVGNTTSADATSFGWGWAERTLATAGALAPGWTVGAASFVGSSVAFKEGAPPPAPTGPPTLVMPPL